MAYADLRTYAPPLTFEPPDPGAGMGVPLSDYLRTIAARAVELPGVVPAAARYLEGEPEDELDRQNLAAAQYMQERLHAASANVMQGAAPDTQRLLASTVASRDFMAQPFSWTFLQLANTVPDVAAAVVAGAVSGGTIPALMAAGAASGTLSAADFLSTAQRSVDERSDEQLKADSILYRGYRNAGMPEARARVRMQQDMTKYQAPILFALGTATGAFGAPGQVLRAAGIAPVSRGVERGIAGRVAREAGIGGGTEAVQSFGESVAAQTGAVTAGFQPGVDVSEALIAAASGALPGALLGGVTGIPRDRGPQPLPAPGQAQPGAAGAAGAAQPLTPPGGAGALPVGGGVSRLPTGPAPPPPVQGAPRQPPAPRPVGPPSPGPGIAGPTLQAEEGIAAALQRAAYPGAPVSRPPPERGPPPRGPTVEGAIPHDPNAPFFEQPPFPASRIGLPGAELGDENLGPANERFPLSERYSRRLGLPPGSRAAQPVVPNLAPVEGALPVDRRPGMARRYDLGGAAARGYDPGYMHRRGISGPPQRPGVTVGTGPSPAQLSALARGENLNLFGQAAGPAQPMGALQGGLTMAPTPPPPPPIQLGGPSLLPSPDATQAELPIRRPPARPTPPRPDAEQLPLPGMQGPAPPAAGIAPIPRDRSLVPGLAPRPIPVTPTEQTYPEEPRQEELFQLEHNFERVLSFLLNRAGEDDDHFSFLLDYFENQPDAGLDAELARERDQSDPHQLLELLALLTERRRREGQPEAPRQVFASEEERRGVQNMQVRRPQLTREPLDVAPRPGAIAGRVKPSFMSIEGLQFLEAAEENAFRQMEQNAYQTEQEELRQAKEIKNREAGVRGEDVERVKIQYKRKSPKWVKEREAEDDRTVELFEEYRDDEWEPIAGELKQEPDEKAKDFKARELQQFKRDNLPRFEDIVQLSENRNIKRRERIEEETLRETMWLSEVRRVRDLLRDGKMNAEKADEVYKFWDNELEARKGNWAPIAESRREAGERRKGKTPSAQQTIAGEEGEAIDPRLQGRTMPGEILPDEAPPPGGWAVSQEVGEEQYAPSVYGTVPSGTRRHLAGGELLPSGARRLPSGKVVLEETKVPGLAVALPPSPRLAADLARHPAEKPEPLGEREVKGRKKPQKVERLLTISRRAKAEPPEGELTRRPGETKEAFQERKQRQEGIAGVEVSEEEQLRLLRTRAREVAAERRAKAAKGEELPREKPEPPRQKRPGVEEEEREQEREPETEQREGLEKITVGVREEGRAEEEALPGLRGERWRGEFAAAEEAAPDITPLTDVVREAIRTVERLASEVETTPPRVGAERQKIIKDAFALIRSLKLLPRLREAVRKLELAGSTREQINRLAEQLKGEHPLPMLATAIKELKDLRAAFPQRSVSGKTLDQTIFELEKLGKKKGIMPVTPAALQTKARLIRQEKAERLAATRAETAERRKPKEAPAVVPVAGRAEAYRHPEHARLMKTPLGRAELAGRKAFLAGKPKNPLGGRYAEAWQKGFDEARELQRAMARGEAEAVSKQAGKEIPSTSQHARTMAKIQEMTAKVAAEEAKIAKKRTPKQEAAGNFTKGHLSLEGFRISLEVAKMALRTMANGVQVRTKFPYGYFVGVKGADGENIEVWLGPRAGVPALTSRAKVKPEIPLTLDAKQRYPVTVISHVFETGREKNSVMLGFDSVDAALAAFTASSPKEGVRITDHRHMTMPEFKTWMASPNVKKPVATLGRSGLYGGYFQRGVRSVITGEEGLLSDEEQFAQLQPDRPYEDRIRALGVQRASFEQVQRFALGGYWSNKELNTAMQRMLDNIAPYVDDVSIYFLDAEQMGVASTRGMQAEGIPNVAGQYNADEDVVIIWSGMRQVFSTETTAERVLHELAHPAFDRVLRTNQDIRNATIQVAEELQAALDAIGNKKEFYAFTNIHEFVAEFIGNTSMKRRMAQIKASPSLKKFLRDTGIKTPVRTLLDAMRRLFAKVFGLPQSQVNDSLLDAMFNIQSEMQRRMPARTGKAYRSTSDYDWRREQYTESIESKGPNYPFGKRGINFNFPITTNAITDFGDAFRQHLPESLGGPARQGQTRVPLFIHYRGTDELVQALKTIEDSEQAARAGRDLSNAKEQRRVSADDIVREFEPALAKFYALEKRWKGRPEWKAFVSLLHDETMYGVWADRSIAQQFPKKTTQNAQARNRHADLAARLKALPEELKAARQEAAALYEDMQRRIRDAIGANRLNVLAPEGMSPDVLERILAGEETEHDIATLGQDVIDDIFDAHAVSTLTGPYYPFIRRGDWVVNARYILKPPIAGLQGKLVPGLDNVFEFTGPRAKEHAEHYASIQELKSFVRGIWVDRNTGSEYGRDADGKDVRISPADTDAEHRWRVRIQNQHTEFLETKNEAQIRAKELEDDPARFADVRGVEGTRFREQTLDWRTDNATKLKHPDFERFLKRLKKNERFLALPDHLQNAFVQQMWQAALQSLGATRLSARYMPRKYVQGMNREFTRNMADYAQVTSSTLANFQHQPALEDAMNRLFNSVQGDSKVSSAAKSAIVKELMQRGRDSIVTQQPGRIDGVIRRLAQLAFTYFLGSPSYTLNNLLQTTVAWTTLAGTYGPGMATRLMGKAYEDVAALKMLGTALKATKERALGRAGADYFEQLIIGDQISATEKAMLRRLRELGVLGSGTGIEIDRLIRSPTDTLLGKGDAALYYMTELARELPRASEMINRSVVALASFRAELARNGGDIDAATLKAQEVTNLTQGLYSASDAAPIFNSRGGQLTLVFRKFGALMYGLLGHQIGRVIRNANPNDRAEALKSLGYLAATTTAMAGTLGLPTDVFKALLGGLNAAGVPGVPTWNDVEHWQREIFAEFFGATGGEMLTRGIPRLFGIDLSQRVGLEGLLFHGEPRTSEEYDVKAFILENLAGAPLGMSYDMSFDGLNKILNGNFVEGAEKVLPLKMLRDAAAAWRETTVGRTTEAGYVAQRPSSLVQGLVRAAGYTPAAHAETTEARNYFFRASARLKGDRGDYMHRWNSARGSERSRLWLEIVEWNRDQEPSARLSRADLDDYKKRRRTEEAPFGMRLDDVNRPLFESLAGPYPSMAVH